MKINILLLMLLTLPFVNCSSSSSEEEVSSNNEEEDGSTTETFDSEKLIGTPFEALENGNDFLGSFFFCDQYRTETIDEFPIQIFTAFFTPTEEEYIEMGIEIANTAIGFEAYQLSDEWDDTMRVIYKVTNSDGEFAGHTSAVDFDYNGLNVAETVSPDWSIQIQEFDGIYEYLIAHELGHATGLEHFLINYESDELLTLEEYSLMGPDSNYDHHEMTDYNFMMEMQGEIMQNHLGDTSGTFDTGSCPD